jgi:hypothetical protein
MHELPGVTVYGAAQSEAALKAKSLALRVIVEDIEHCELEHDGDLLGYPSLQGRMARHKGASGGLRISGTCTAQ